ncbi:MAG: response regulator transcription factor [Pusillimonas sp.]
MITTARIAIIEDNDDLREELVFFLQSRGYPVWGKRNAEAFWKHLHLHPADIVLVDIGLPGEDGFSVVEYLKSLGRYGLIVLTARGGMHDRLRGLNLGADQYLVKPVNFADLAEQINALWTRMQLNATPELSGADVITPQLWQLDNNRQELVSPDGIPLPLTRQEYKLVEMLHRHSDEICTKEMLHDFLFGYAEVPDTHRIDVVLNRLRSKARQISLRLPIRSIFGKGLVLVSSA